MRGFHVTGGLIFPIYHRVHIILRDLRYGKLARRENIPVIDSDPYLLFLLFPYLKLGIFPIVFSIAL
jgi:hypothetical protein